MRRGEYIGIHGSNELQPRIIKKVSKGYVVRGERDKDVDWALTFLGFN